MYRKFMIARGSFVNIGQSDEILLENIRQNVLANSKSFIEGVDHTYYDYN